MENKHKITNPSTKPLRTTQRQTPSLQRGCSSIQKHRRTKTYLLIRYKRWLALPPCQQNYNPCLFASRIFVLEQDNYWYTLNPDHHT